MNDLPQYRDLDVQKVASLTRRHGGRHRRPGSRRQCDASHSSTGEMERSSCPPRSAAAPHRPPRKAMSAPSGSGHRVRTLDHPPATCPANLPDVLTS